MSILKYMHVRNTKIGIFNLKEGYAPDLLLLLELVFYVIRISTRMPAALYSGIPTRSMQHDSYATPCDWKAHQWITVMQKIVLENINILGFQP